MDWAQVLTVVGSSTVLATILNSVITTLRDRNNNRVVERKNLADEENDMVTRYQTMAQEERAAKESAVKEAREMLTLARDQNKTLQEALDGLNRIVADLRVTQGVQLDAIEGITKDRDRISNLLNEALLKVENLKARLEKAEDELLEATDPVTKKGVEEFNKRFKQLKTDEPWADPNA